VRGGECAIALELAAGDAVAVDLADVESTVGGCRGLGSTQSMATEMAISPARFMDMFYHCQPRSGPITRHASRSDGDDREDRRSGDAFGELARSRTGVLDVDRAGD
jgi:hypothetical protein